MNNITEEIINETTIGLKNLSLLRVTYRGNKRPEWSLRFATTKTGEGIDYPFPTKKKAAALYAALVAEEVAA